MVMADKRARMDLELGVEKLMVQLPPPSQLQQLLLAMLCTSTSLFLPKSQFCRHGFLPY
jgi:hypothetical protein